MMLSVALVAADHDDDSDDGYEREHNTYVEHKDSYKEHDADDREYDDWDVSDDFIITTKDLTILQVDLTPIPDIPKNNLSNISVVRMDDHRFLDLANRIDFFVNYSVQNGSPDMNHSDNSVVLRGNHSSAIVKKSFFQRLLALFGGK